MARERKGFCDTLSSAIFLEAFYEKCHVSDFREVCHGKVKDFGVCLNVFSMLAI